MNHINYKEAHLFGRYITLEHLKPLLEDLKDTFIIDVLGYSEANMPIHLIKAGKGPKKLLFWSQMHGNESTTTKALFDFVNFLKSTNKEALNILSSCTLYFIPMLNPDGSQMYTRVNANKVDLNRDAQNLTQKESRIFRQLLKDIQPDYAFNLHGQRTIFSAGEFNKSAIVSFLSPAGDEQRTVTFSRKKAMEIIAEMNTMLQTRIPNHVGRYDDGFNINCTGDTLEDLGIPTILFEAGHYPGDYEREITRELIYESLMTAVRYISNNEIKGDAYKLYFEIPENEKLFYDCIIRNVSIADKKSTDIAIQYIEKLVRDKVEFVPVIVKIGDLNKFYAHKEFSGKNRIIRHYNDIVEVVPDIEMNKFYLNDELFSL